MDIRDHKKNFRDTTSLMGLKYALDAGTTMRKPDNSAKGADAVRNAVIALKRIAIAMRALNGGLNEMSRVWRGIAARKQKQGLGQYGDLRKILQRQDGMLWKGRSFDACLRIQGLQNRSTKRRKG